MTTIAVRCEYDTAFDAHIFGPVVGPVGDVDAFYKEFVAEDIPGNGGYVDWQFIDTDHLLSVEGLRVELTDEDA